MSDEAASGGRGADRSPYVESQVIMTTVRVVAPFTFTYGLFLAFHGGGSPGGGFQGGAIVGATVLMIAFAFGIEPTREWLSNRVVAGLVSAGVVAFALIGLVPLLFDGRFLQHTVYGDDLGIYHGTKYALEGVEIVGITPIVAAAVVGLFFAIAAGTRDGGAGAEADPTAGGTVAADDAAADGGVVSNERATYRRRRDTDASAPSGDARGRDGDASDGFAGGSGGSVSDSGGSVGDSGRSAGAADDSTDRTDGGESV